MNKNIIYLFFGAIVISVVISNFLGPQQVAFGVPTIDTALVKQTKVASSGLMISGDSIILEGFDKPVLGYAIINPNSGNKEIISFESRTLDKEGKVILEGLERGIASTPVRNHTGFSDIIFLEPRQINSSGDTINLITQLEALAR